MTKLLNISKHIWFSMIMTIFASITILYFILNMNIDSSFSTQVVASSSYSVLLDSKGAYLLNQKAHITLRINNKYIKCGIKKIKYLEKEQKFQVVLEGLNQLALIPQTKIMVEIIYDKTKVIKTLFNT